MTPSVWEVGWKLWVVHLELGDTPMESGSMTDLSANASAQWGYATFGADAVVGAEPGYDFLDSPSWRSSHPLPSSTATEGTPNCSI